MPRWAPLLLVAALLVAGCISGTDAAPERAAAADAAAASRPVVVAVVDSGVNPYHERFQVGSGRGVEAHLAEVGSPTLLRLSPEGSYEERLERDGALWEGVERERLYAFEGTRLLAISFDESETPILDGVGHGTGVAYLALREAPEALVVMVHVDTTLCNLNRGTEDCPVHPPVSKALRWVAEQPWIDVVSVSMGTPGNVPDAPEASAEVRDQVAALALLHDRGKILLNGAGNTVAPAWASRNGGPPWVISVGGVYAADRGETPQASKGADVVANHSEHVPLATSVDEMSPVLGTSYATPIVAGTLAKALQEVRISLAPAQPGAGLACGAPLASCVGPRAFRDALNASAVHFGPTDWTPTGQDANDTRYRLVTVGLPIVAPEVQMGWGYVHGGLARDVAARVLSGDLAPPPEKARAAEHQARVQALREAYWSTIGAR